MANIHFETYGCQMNISEADSLASKATLRGHILVDDPRQADFVVINTCSIRLTAEQKIEGRLGFYRALNREVPQDLKVILMGCMSENVGHEIQGKFADVVNIVWGTYNKDDFFDYLDDLTTQKQSLGFGAAYSFMPVAASKEFPFKAFLPISHGCNKFCTYCIVPKVRGKEVNRNFQEIVDNVKKLVDEGVLELCLLGQTIDTYEYDGKRFPDLMDAIASQTGIQRITFLTPHPREFLLETIELMNTHENIIPFLHFPFQAGNNRILRKMNRGYTREEYLAKIDEIRSIRPDIKLSTDIIVGFPTETDAEFEESLDIIKKVRFNEAFMYRYNIRPNTPAEQFGDQIPEEEKLRRLELLVTTQREIQAELLKEQVGLETTALFDRESKYSDRVFAETGKKQFLGRLHNNTVCVIESEENLIGKIFPIKITDTYNAVLKGQLL